MAVGYTARKFC